MGSIRFRKSIKLAPGVKLNLNKKSSSITIGGKGVHRTYSSTGRKTTSVGIPGTGISYVDTQMPKKKVANPVKRQADTSGYYDPARSNESEDLFGSPLPEQGEDDFERMARENYEDSGRGGAGRGGNSSGFGPGGNGSGNGPKPKKSLLTMIKNGLLWCVSLLFVLFALVYIPSWTCFFMILGALITNPAVRSLLDQAGYKPKRGLSVFLAIVFFFTGVMLSPDSEEDPASRGPVPEVTEADTSEEETVESTQAAVPLSYVDPSDMNAICGEGKLELNWSALEGADSYCIYKLVDDQWTTLTKTNSLNYDDSRVESGEQYSYMVVGLDENQTEDEIPSGNPFTTAYVGPLSADGLKLSNSTQGVEIYWQPVTGAESYLVERKTENGSYETIASVTGENTHYTDSNAGEELYTYLVCATLSLGSDSVNGSGASKEIARIGGVTSFNIADGEEGFSADWEMVEGVDGYELQYGTDQTFATNATLNDVGSSVSKTVSELAVGDYFIRVRTYKTIGNKTYYSAWTDTKTFKAVPVETTKAAETVKQAPIEKTNSNVMEYVLNKNTKKFHNPYCRDVPNIKKKNRKDVEADRADLLKQGYSPCGHCHP